ncbi:cell wall hydrolase [Sphingopyxis sp. BSNA05]|uniref:cell wall hydrolase n=1 Tax=Sphingopyxis sp. BSNA05 TaxID=1236614 RepID=UPI0020B7981E|nr:cell wall hydrolase [Sphingopyxis sp. BSNA05]
MRRDLSGSERTTGCQFTYTCDGSLRRKAASFHWNRAKKVAAEALAGKSYTTVGTATHYHASYVYPYWAPSLRFLGTVGAHRFYSWKGNAGQASAFSQKYRGGEPLPAPNTRRQDAARDNGAVPSLDPIALERAYEAARRKAEAEAVQSERAAALAADSARRNDRSAPALDIHAPRSYKAPDYSAQARAKGGDQAYAGQRLPDASQIKPEFRDSGSWKKNPAASPNRQFSDSFAGNQQWVSLAIALDSRLKALDFIGNEAERSNGDKLDGK